MGKTIVLRMKKFLLSEKFLAGFVCVIALAEIITWNTAWRLEYPIIDNILHFLGGAWVSLLFLHIFKNRRHFFDAEKNLFVTGMFMAGFTALIGVNWEFFEYLVGIAFNDPWIGSGAWGLDTLTDLFLDLLGAGTIALILIF